jgi:hypothetical protein
MEFILDQSPFPFPLHSVERQKVLYESLQIWNLEW